MKFKVSSPWNGHIPMAYQSKTRFFKINQVIYKTSFIQNFRKSAYLPLGIIRGLVNNKSFWKRSLQPFIYFKGIM